MTGHDGLPPDPPTDSDAFDDAPPEEIERIQRLLDSLGDENRLDLGSDRMAPKEPQDPSSESVLTAREALTRAGLLDPPSRSWSTSPTWIALAAVVLIGIGLVVFWPETKPSKSDGPPVLLNARDIQLQPPSLNDDGNVVFRWTCAFSPGDRFDLIVHPAGDSTSILFSARSIYALERAVPSSAFEGHEYVDWKILWYPKEDQGRSTTMSEENVPIPR